jgi:predicted RNase H-like nuclease (RuvC/YqgF family)
LAAEVERLKGEIQAQATRNRELQDSLDKRGAATADFDRLKAQLNSQIARTREVEKTSKVKDDQIAKLRNEVTVQQSHAKVLAKSVDDLQLRLQQMKRLNNQNADPPKP